MTFDYTSELEKEGKELNQEPLAVPSSVAAVVVLEVEKSFVGLQPVAQPLDCKDQKVAEDTNQTEVQLGVHVEALKL